jgi:RNA 2',3'-cyclic 3'-phosphodiesterase
VRASQPTQRLYFGLWPHAEARQVLSDAVAEILRRSGGRPVPPANLHVTLVFLGAVPSHRIAQLAAVARGCAARCASTAAPTLCFDQVAHWAEPRILAVLARELAPAVPALALALREATCGAGFTPDLKPFRAHVTVARQVAKPPPPFTMRAVRWAFESFALIDSRNSGGAPVYSVVESYPLVGLQKAHE